MTRKILIGTTRRCGSTLLFNMIASLLELNEYKVWRGFITQYENNKEEINNSKYDFIIIKSHEKIPIDEFDIIFTITRDILECIASPKNREGDEDYDINVLDYAERYIDYEIFWSGNSDVMFDYHKLIKEKNSYVEKISEILKIDFFDIKVIENHYFSLEFDKMLLFENHINKKDSDYKEILTEEEIKKISELYKNKYIENIKKVIHKK